MSSKLSVRYSTNGNRVYFYYGKVLECICVGDSDLLFKNDMKNLFGNEWNGKDTLVDYLTMFLISGEENKNLVLNYFSDKEMYNYKVMVKKLNTFIDLFESN